MSEPVKTVIPLPGVKGHFLVLLQIRRDEAMLKVNKQFAKELEVLVKELDIPAGAQVSIGDDVDGVPTLVYETV